MNSIEKYHEAVRFIESFSNTSIRKNFNKDKIDPNLFIYRVRYFLNLFGNPDKDFKYIHITGTAGKGTVSTMIQNILTVSGKKTGLFTSPYISTTIEEIRVDDKYIDSKVFVELVEYIKPFIEQSKSGPYGNPSAFELLFIIAILYFKKQKCEWVVLEVGLGGRYDATNVIKNPVVTAITNIDYDHTEILGKTLKEIANDKAGIIKEGSTFFTSEQRSDLQKLFKKICDDKNVRPYFIKHQDNYSKYNTALVTVIAQSLGITNKDIQKGIQNTKLPCRFEIIQNKPAIVLDGAHNIAKIQSTIFRLKKSAFKKLYLIIALADTKKERTDILKLLLLLPYLKHVIFTQVISDERKTVSPKFLLSVAKKYKKKKDTLEIIENQNDALTYAIQNAATDDFILVTGSFFLAGELRKKWVSEEWILKNRKSFKK